MRDDLPGPRVLWARWAALAAALTAVGHDDVWTVGPAGAHHDDHGGNWAHLTLVEGGRAVLYGYDHEYSDTVTADPPIDLLAGGPDWLPWDDLVRHAADDQLGHVRWHDGTAWSRPGHDLADGLTSTAGPVLDEAAALTELAEFAFEWGGHEPDDPAERAAVRAAAARLLAAAAGGRTDAGVLGAYPCRDVPAGLAVAAAGGITPGGVPPATPAGRRPASRTVRVLSDIAHDRLVWAAMHAEPERDRPAPPPSAALGELIAWVRDQRHGPLLVRMDDTSASAQSGTGPGLDGFRTVTRLARRLREAEADAAHGRWLFLRVAPDGAVERRYDSWPPWWDDDGHSGPWRGALREETDRRAAPWRPGWTALLDPAVAYRRA